MRHFSRLSAVALGQRRSAPCKPEGTGLSHHSRYNNLASTAPMKLSALPKVIACMVISDNTFNFNSPVCRVQIDGRRHRNNEDADEIRFPLEGLELA